MGYQVTLAPSARRDLEEIVRYISLDAPDRALEFGRLLMAKTKSLVQFPEMGRLEPELGDHHEALVYIGMIGHSARHLTAKHCQLLATMAF